MVLTVQSSWVGISASMASQRQAKAPAAGVAAGADRRYAGSSGGPHAPRAPWTGERKRSGRGVPLRC